MAGNRGEGDGSYGDQRDHRNEGDGPRLADDPRAVAAADEWRRRFGREGYEGSYGQHGHGSHDEPYHSYRQRQIEQLDREYAEWCREREQQFHRDFGDWRQQRRARTSTPGAQIDSD